MGALNLRSFLCPIRTCWFCQINVIKICNISTPFSFYRLPFFLPLSVYLFCTHVYLFMITTSAVFTPLVSFTFLNWIIVGYTGKSVAENDEYVSMSSLAVLIARTIPPVVGQLILFTYEWNISAQRSEVCPRQTQRFYELKRAIIIDEEKYYD